MGKRQALGWLGAALCSVALVVAGGLVVSSFAVSRYLQTSSAALNQSDETQPESTPDPDELASVQRLVGTIVSMPGVATATNTVQSPAAGATRFSYDVSVIMNTDATSGDAAKLVFTMTRALQNSRVSLELSSPACNGHAASVINFEHAFDAPVARTTVASVTDAVAVAAAVPGVDNVHVTVPYTWNLSSGDLTVDFASSASSHEAAFEQALQRTALAGVDWSPGP